jgi:hypothetical protein
MKILGLSRRARVALLIAMALVVIPAEALILPEILDRRPLCVRADEWVAAHKDNLPQLYDQLISYPMAHRRAIFGNLTPEARATLWRENLARFAKGRELTPGQRDYLERAAKEIVTPENYRQGGPGEAVLRHEAALILELFPDEEARRMFVRLGPEDPQLASFEGARLTLGHKVQAALLPASTSRGDGAPASDGPSKGYGTCTCNVEAGGWYPWECYGGSFTCAWVGCAQWTACGLFGYSTCTGCCCYWRDETICDCGTP